MQERVHDVRTVTCSSDTLEEGILSLFLQLYASSASSNFSSAFQFLWNQQPSAYSGFLWLSLQHQLWAPLGPAIKSALASFGDLMNWERFRNDAIYLSHKTFIYQLNFFLFSIYVQKQVISFFPFSSFPKHVKGKSSETSMVCLLHVSHPLLSISFKLSSNYFIWKGSGPYPTNDNNQSRYSK